jgi:hypothetical protein
VKSLSDEERMKEIKQYLNYLIEKVKKKDAKSMVINSNIYIEDVELLLRLLEKGPADKPVLLGPAVPMTGADIDKFIEKEMEKK